MRRVEPDLNGYHPYLFCEKYHGQWFPFNQTRTGHTAVLRLFGDLQRKYKLPNPTCHTAACQGIALLYIEKCCSIQELSHGNFDQGIMRPKLLAAAVNYQTQYGELNLGREALTDTKGKLLCQALHIDKNPTRFSIESIINRIQQAPKNSNIFFITGYLKNLLASKSHTAAHAIVISNLGDKWTFFEALRGEVAFPNFEALSAWLLVEARLGSLKEFYAKTEVRPGVFRVFTHFQLDIYRKKFPLTLQKQTLPRANM